MIVNLPEKFGAFTAYVRVLESDVEWLKNENAALRRKLAEAEWAADADQWLHSEDSQ